ncbi:heavy metal-associated isoprenylated plant protein 7-like [Zingiber officinale]|uniref:heavy metal-associated isoprenylated plant protein 7-like n=1 Tax=Zingiber officinale TaxID=94328 RepID=UPI001C4D53A5|nr:heavy metal-associated isoprenylated plant protein 7-like [Zingiber officinale]
MVLKSYEGVAEVARDWRAQKVVVKGKKAVANPLKVVEHLERETDKKVQLLTPLPPPQPGKKKPTRRKEEEDKKDEVPQQNPQSAHLFFSLRSLLLLFSKLFATFLPPKIVVTSFQLQMHWSACTRKMAKKILKMQGFLCLLLFHSFVNRHKRYEKLVCAT